MRQMVKTATPVALTARERLREQQKLEAAKLAAVLAAEERLAAERQRHTAAIAAADAALAAQGALVADATCALIDVSGLERAAAILGRSKSELGRIARDHRAANSAPAPADNGSRAIGTSSGVARGHGEAR
jgi:hypothetical protein